MAEPDFIPANTDPDFIPASAASGKFTQLPGYPTLADAPGGPKSQPMSKVRTLVGSPYNPGRIERGIVDQIGGVAQSAANVSAPVILHRTAQRIGIAGPNSRLYPEEGTLKDSARDATLLMAGGAEGLDAEAAGVSPRVIAPQVVTPKSAAPATLGETPGMLGRAGEVALRRVGRIPGVQAVKDADYILRGPKVEPKAAAPKPAPVRPAPIPETNGIQWGTGGKGPLDLRGQRIPAPAVFPGAPLPEHPGVFPGANLPEHPGVFPGAPEPTATPEQLNPSLTSDARTLPGQVGKEVIRPKVAPAQPIPARSGLALPPASEAVEKPAAAPAVASPTLTNGEKVKPAVASALGRQLREGLGAAEPPQSVVPGVAIKHQPTAQVATTPLPEGFTEAKDSSWVRGFKYDPKAREFEYITKDGNHYVRGDVGPEAAAEYQRVQQETASHGKAVNALKQHPEGGVGQFKVINGKRVAVVKPAPVTDLAQQIKDSAEPSQAPVGKPLTDLGKQIKNAAKTDKPAARVGKPPGIAPEGDLTSIVQRSIDAVNAVKAKKTPRIAKPN